ncbi:MAG: hypothetical protein LCH96_02200 [Actinobacteria bacterium]|nr:hypothetical protein [Actinomycetota bacterium]
MLVPASEIITPTLAADATGTSLMTHIADSRRNDDNSARGIGTLIAVTRWIAIILMAIHLIGAVVVLRRNHEKLAFHRLSVGAWVLCPIPYVACATTAMTGT